MTQIGFRLLMPLIVLAVAAIVVLLQIAIYRHHKLTASLTLIGTAMAGLVIPIAWFASPGMVTPLLLVDQMGLFYLAILIFATFVITLLSINYLKKSQIYPDEYYLLLILAALGAGILALSVHFGAFFLGLEILSISLYGLIGYLRDREPNIEAAMKYLVLASLSTAFLMFGVALLYADQGTLSFQQMAFNQGYGSSSYTILPITGLGLLLVGIGFKLAVVPFHMWTPDVYQGAPAPVSGFIATISKGAVFVFLLRFSAFSGLQEIRGFELMLILIAVFSMFAGNLLALTQNNVKRILAYSSIANLGYLLVALLANSQQGVVGAMFYLTAYFVTTLGAFGVITIMSGTGRDAEKIEDYRGLFWKKPWIAALFTLSMLSLIGIPLTAGFIGKFLILTAGVGSMMWLLVLALVVSSAIGLYFYLRIVGFMFLRPDSEPASQKESTSMQFPESLALVLLLLLLLLLGLYPASLIGVIQSAVAHL
jgi:NADH-quinone oxidoreductase subunit N